MSCRALRRRPTYLRAPEPTAVAADPNPSSQAQRLGEEQAATIAAQLRAQIPGSTDPERLERLACEAERKCGSRIR